MPRSLKRNACEASRRSYRISLRGSPEEFAWLLEHYGIAEEDDVRWQWLIGYLSDSLYEDEIEDDEVYDFIKVEEAVRAYLAPFLKNRQRNALTYP